MKLNMHLPQPDYLMAGITGVLAPSLEASGSSYCETSQKVGWASGLFGISNMPLYVSIFSHRNLSNVDAKLHEQHI